MDAAVDDKDWIAEVTGGRVCRFERITAGASRGTWLVDVERADGEHLELVLRRDTGDGPLSGTELSLEREAAVYAALDGSDVLIPRLVARSPDGDALLVERAAGTEDLAAAGDSNARARVLEDFVQALATLHRVDPASLDLPGLARPSSAEEHALAELDLWQRIFDGHVRRPAPLARFAFGWLRRHAPASVSRTVLCHGDAGPGNFLHRDGRVTALLDWEFAHLGDPTDDLAWFTVRGMQTLDADTTRACLRLYSDLTGTPVEPERLQYYRAFVLLRMIVACLVALERQRGRMDTSTYFNLVPFASCQLTRVLAGLDGIAIEPPEPTAPEPPGLDAEVLTALTEDLVNVVLPALGDAAASARAAGMLSLLLHVQAAQSLRGPVDRADLDDLRAVVGVRPTSVAEGLTALDEIVAGAGSERDDELIGLFARMAERGVALWPAVAASAATLRLDPVELP